jgi:hypothetical protein
MPGRDVRRRSSLPNTTPLGQPTKPPPTHLICPPQASTNVLLAHFMSIVFTNLMLGTLNRLGTATAQG